MRSCGAVALVLLAIITECLGARHSDRSRHRPSSSRSVSKAVNTKKEVVDFDCPEEFGYYPHPTDCTLYYVCVFGGALQESCTGGLMYSHELQTCDWPRNVGCDGALVAASISGDELERINEREPLPAPPQHRRAPSPPPPRAQPQPNPVVTSRGQPKFNRNEYEKQQQLYEEVDDLPPVEEIETDRQQRVYRGQPSTIGQVQKDRDGYIGQINPGRNLNSNIIPASIPQNNGKIGSFSFGTQVEDRRTATITPSPQTYNGDNDNDYLADRPLDVETNEIDVYDVTIKPHNRSKREISDVQLGVNGTNITRSNQSEGISKRSDSDVEFEYFEAEPEIFDDKIPDLEDTERGKRQAGYYFKNGYKIPGKNWETNKPFNTLSAQQHNYNQNAQTNRYVPVYNNGLNNYDYSRRPITHENNYYSTANPFLSYQSNDNQSQRFKPSLLDPYKKNIASQIITKSPPISSLNNYENSNSYTSFNGAVYNNAPKPNYNSKFSSQIISSTNRPSGHFSFSDSSILPSTVVTGKPLPNPTSIQPQHQYRPSTDTREKVQSRLPIHNENYESNGRQPSNNQDYNYDDESDEEEDSSEEEPEHPFPKPPHEFTNPRNKYTNIENPFANPNFDFDTYLAKISNGQYSTTARPQNHQISQINSIVPSIELTTSSLSGTGIHSSTLNYKGVSTPKPFTLSSGFSTIAPTGSNINSLSGLQQYQSQVIQKPNPSQQSYILQPYQQQQQQTSAEHVYNRQPQQNTGIPLETFRARLQPPNFQDDRELPITYSFKRPIDTFSKQSYNQNEANQQNNQQFVSGTPATAATPTQKYTLSSESYESLKPNFGVTNKPYLISSVIPHQQYLNIKQTTSKPLTTIANEQLSALQHYWNNPSTPNPYSVQNVALKTTTTPNIAKLEKLFAQAIKSSTQAPVKNYNMYVNIPSTTKAPPKRRPIPKPSPEMNDYYYDDDEDQYYHVPPVKSKYMPSSEVMPKRPPMAQNYKEYDDSYEDSEEQTVNINPKPITRRPTTYNTYKIPTSPVYANDVTVVTRGPIKENKGKNENGKLAVPVLFGTASPPKNILIQPEISNYDIHHASQNRSAHIRKPIYLENGPHTDKPPKYLNQTTLRPYTVRHRLAKPTTVQEPNVQNFDKQNRGRVRHPNLVAQLKSTTPYDSHNQETRYTKTKHDDKTNSLEPTESITPVSYSANPRPKMLYNGSQTYSPDQYDPYYAVYDEDGELYKDTDYDVQQYNTASLRPAVQQTYRGTPPPARRPVEAYTPRPSPDDYDDALIQGQINNNQNQYQSAIRHSTRGEGNELGYDHNPSSVKTTLYEATAISTSPSTTSTSTTTTTTSTTTHRPTTAPYTEAMTPSRYSSRSSTDETPNSLSESSPANAPSYEPTSVPSTPSAINLSSLAKPFEKTDYMHKLKETATTTELPTHRRSHVTNKNNKYTVEVTQTTPNRGKKKVLSLTTGFSIRRNLNDTNTPYTLTVLTRPFDEYNKLFKSEGPTDSSSNSDQQASTNYSDPVSLNIEESIKTTIRTDITYPSSTQASLRRNDVFSTIVDEYDIPIYVRPTSRIRSTTYKATTTPSTTTTTTFTPSSSTEHTKYYVKSVTNRPVHISLDNVEHLDSTDNTINAEALIERRLQKNTTEYSSNESFATSKQQNYDRGNSFWNEAVVSPYKSLDNIRNIYSDNADVFQDSTSRTPSTSRLITKTRKTVNSTTTLPSFVTKSIPKRAKNSRSKSSYYSYRVEDAVPDQTTKIFNDKVKNVIQVLINNFVSTPTPRLIEEFSSSTIKSTTPLVTKVENKVVNIGFQKKPYKLIEETPSRNSVKRLEIITESSLNKQIKPSTDTLSIINKFKTPSTGFSSTTPLVTTMSSTTPLTLMNPPTSPMQIETLNENKPYTPSRSSYQSRFNSLLTNKPDFGNSQKFKKVVRDESVSSDDVITNRNDDQVLPTSSISEVKTSSESEWRSPTSEIVNEIASTTSTTKATSTIKIEPTSTTTTTTTTKIISFPTRVSRVNPAIKLAATNPGSGRRSYQSPSKCSSDNSLAANPKCNEIKYQRPTSTRGRGSAHYSTQGGSDTQQVQAVPNRGTPPTRSRPTLKPSTAIVSKSTEYVDIYNYPPSRPAPVYPQPTPDKTAAKCRKDVCLLPDCYCGGKDIPGDLPLESTPQIVLLTFDDSVNDLNKGLYTDLFEKGRVNPNGCPITATFYVSHEWTDYSQVQNLYSAGHEMASHTVSHSFGEQFSQKKWNREVGGQREILAAYGGVKVEDVRGMRAPFLSIGGNKMFKMLYDSNFTYDSSMPVYENRPPSWPYTLDYKLFHDCMIPPCPTKSYPGVWEVPMVMWQDLNGGRCSMGDACANPAEAEGVYKMILKNFDRHYTSNRAPFGLFYHAAWFTQPHHKEGFIMFLDFINQMPDVWIVTNWQALQWVRDPTPISRINNFQPFQCNYQDRPKKCNNPKVCNLWHKSGVRYMRTCQPCPEIYPWTGKSGIRSSRIDNDNSE